MSGGATAKHCTTSNLNQQEQIHIIPEVTSHALGAPSWTELSTTDETGALSFYAALFGWVDEPHEMGPDWYYHMQKVRGQYACSIYKQGEEERNQNVPPHWNVYFNVNNADAIRQPKEHIGAGIQGWDWRDGLERTDDHRPRRGNRILQSHVGP